MVKITLLLLAIFLLFGCVFSATQEVEFAEPAQLQRNARGCAPRPNPTTAPTTRPNPTTAPTTRPTSSPTVAPTASPTVAPTASPTLAPTTRPVRPPPVAVTTRPTTPVGLCDVVPARQEPIKLLVPLYVYPGAAWDTVAAAATKVGVIAIVNPNSGPLPAGPNSAYKTYMPKLANAGVEMIGYVYTTYGSRPIDAVKADIDLYATKYSGIIGIFFDEASSSAKDLAYYTQAYNHVKSKGMVHVILNPGVQPDQGYLAISTNIVIFENYGTSASSSSYSSWVKCAPNAAQKAGYKYKFSGIAHTVPAAGSAAIISSFANQGMGLIYVTDGAGGCCTYNELAKYLPEQASEIARLNA